LELQKQSEWANFYSTLTTHEGTCSGNVCDTFGDKLSWMIPEIPAYSSITVGVPPKTLASPSENILNMNVNVVDDSGVEARTSEAVLLTKNRPIEFNLSTDTFPLLPGNPFELSLTYGVDLQSNDIDSASLTLLLPPGVVVTNASDMGQISDGKVFWDLGSVSSGQSDVVATSLRVENNVDLMGKHLSFHGYIENEDSKLENGPHASRDLHVPVTKLRQLELNIDANPIAIEPDLETSIDLKITNTSPFSRSDVQVHLRFPEEFVNIHSSKLSSGGTCSGSICGDHEGELVTWSIDKIEGGDTSVITIKPKLLKTISPGTIIPIYAYVTNANATTSYQQLNLRVIPPAVESN